MVGGAFLRSQVPGSPGETLVTPVDPARSCWRLGGVFGLARGNFLEVLPNLLLRRSLDYADSISG